MTLPRFRPLSALLFAAALLGLGPAAQAAPRQPSQTNKLFLHTKPAVVRIYCGYLGRWNWDGRAWDTQSVSSGSGFIFNPNGYILTNAHVVSDVKEGDAAGKRGLLVQLAVQALRAKGLQVNQQTVAQAAQVLANQAGLVEFKRIALVVLQSGRQVPFEIKSYGAPSGQGQDLATGKDVAVLKIEVKNAPSLRIGNSDETQVGDRIFIMGYPAAADSNLLDSKSALEPTINDGSISAKKNTRDGAPIIQTNTSATHGNSGGPVINEKGEVIGLLTFRGDTVNGQEVQGFNFIVPSSTAMEFVRQAGSAYGVSPLDEKWHQGLEFFWDGEYRNAKDEFQQVLSLFPDHGEAVKLSSECQEHIAKGDDGSLTGSMSRFALVGCGCGGVLVLGVVLIVWLVRRGKKGKAGAPPAQHPQPPQHPAATPAGGPVVGTEMFRGGATGGQLVCLVGPVQGQSFPLGQGVYLGRDAARAQVVVQDSQVSGQHVWVGPLAGRIVARDPGSTNGTFLNDPASPRIGEAELKPGDRLFLGPKGSVVFEYRP